MGWLPLVRHRYSVSTLVGEALSGIVNDLLISTHLPNALPLPTSKPSQSKGLSLGVVGLPTETTSEALAPAIGTKVQAEILIFLMRVSWSCPSAALYVRLYS